MLRSAASKALGLGRATALPVVVAVMLVLVFGTTPASAHGGYRGLFHLGHNNVSGAVSTLVGNVATGSALVVKNPSGGSALGLEVNAGQAPLTVNASAGKATNLDADKLDGKSDTDFYAAGSKVEDSNHADNADKVDELDSTALLPGGDLPHGRTLRGHYDIVSSAEPSSFGIDSSAISFGYRLASLPTVRIIKADTTPPAECPGTVVSPEADPGYLCVYEASAFNVSSGYPTNQGPTRNGVSIIAMSHNVTSTDQNFQTYGTWAVTGN